MSTLALSQEEVKGAAAESCEEREWEGGEGVVCELSETEETEECRHERDGALRLDVVDKTGNRLARRKATLYLRACCLAAE